MPTALFLSPHLDDVAFSCGGTLLRLADDPAWRVILCTVFTASVDDPRGFALRCQTDKGIAPEVDYMALRRSEDAAYAEASGVDAWHWQHREAPHRGYESPTELFAGEHADDIVWQRVRDDLTSLDAEYRPDVVFAPQGLGNHVDHLQTIRAALDVYPGGRTVCWYEDTPYIIRNPSARASALLDAIAEHTPNRVTLSSEVLERKIAGCCAYASQIGFQFGGPGGVREKLTEFHRCPALDNQYVEKFLVDRSLRAPVPFA